MDEGNSMTNLFVLPWGLLLLAAILGWYWLARFADAQRAQALRRLRQGPFPSTKRWRALIPAVLLLLAIAIAQPVQSGARDHAHRAPDVVYLLDVSRSINTRVFVLC